MIDIFLFTSLPVSRIQAVKAMALEFEQTSCGGLNLSVLRGL